MKRVLALIALAALGFSGYWAAGVWALERGLSGWLEERRAEGWVAETEGIATSGFPTEFRATLADLTLADPETGVVWTAPDFGIVAETLSPNRAVAIWPAEQTLGSPYDTLRITSDTMRAGIGFVPGTRLELRDMSADMDAVRVRSEGEGWETALETGRFSVVADPQAANTYEILFTASGVTPAEPLRDVLDPARILPDLIEGLTIDARVAFDAPWDRFAIERARPQITALDLTDLRARWGEMELRAAGELTVDAEGTPEGRITVKATNWREMVQMARRAGVVPEPLVPTIENVLEALAALSGPPETLDAPLTFRNGRVAIGPIPVGRAPDLTIR